MAGLCEDTGSIILEYGVQRWYATLPYHPGGKGQAIPPDLQEIGIFHAEEPQRAVLRVNPELPDDVCASGERSEQGELLMILCIEFPGKSAND